jgi:hypothetical protein
MADLVGACLVLWDPAVRASVLACATSNFVACFVLVNAVICIPLTLVVVVSTGVASVAAVVSIGWLSVGLAGAAAFGEGLLVWFVFVDELERSLSLPGGSEVQGA